MFIIQLFVLTIVLGAASGFVVGAMGYFAARPCNQRSNGRGAIFSLIVLLPSLVALYYVGMSALPVSGIGMFAAGIAKFPAAMSVVMAIYWFADRSDTASHRSNGSG